MLANRTSRWSIGAVVLCVLLLATSWFLLISPRRADATDIRGQATTADSQASLLQTQIAQLKIDYAGLPKQKAALAAIQKQLPPGGDVPSFIRTLQTITAQSGVSLESLTPGAPVVLTATGTNTQTTAGPGTLVSIPMNILVTGQYFEASLFLKTLQTQIDRSYAVSGFSAAPATATDVTAVTGATPAPPTATPTVVPSATATATAMPTSSASSSAAPGLDRISLTLTGSVFVLLDKAVTLDDVAAAAKAAALAATKGSTPVRTPTAVATSTN